jgi:SRSO17 transposase
VEQNRKTAAADESVDHEAHQGLLDELMERVASCFARRETRLTCRDMVHGLLSELEDHNCWTMAEAAGHPGPHRMQHLLSRARCDEQRMLDAAADWAAGHLSAGQGDDGGDAVLIVDETADEKSSDGCAGAARQYSGTVGGIALCQVAVTLTYAAPAGHALIGRALYLPEGWAADEERRELAGVPDEVMFATKPQLAGELLQHAHDRGIRAGFVAGDEVYGGLDLRRGIRERGAGYVLAVRSNHSVTLPSGRRLTVKNAAGLVKPAMWQRMRTGSATKGAKDYDWAMIEVTPDDTPEGQDDGHALLLLRRHRYTGTASYFLCWSPGPVPLAKLIAVAVARWRIEEDHQLSKQVSGLDSGQVTTWASWHRWTAISLLAYAFLAVAAACQRALDASAGLPGLIPVTIPELLRQLRGTVIPEARRDKAHRGTWARWRRHHQYQAQQAHKRWHAYADEVPR